MRKLLNVNAPRLRRVLRTPQSLYLFIDLLTASYDGKCRRVTDDGMVFLRPQPAVAVSPSAAEPEAETQALLARPVVRLDQELDCLSGKLYGEECAQRAFTSGLRRSSSSAAAGAALRLVCALTES